MKTDTTPKVIELKDYKAPHFFIETVFLTVKLHSTETNVQSVLKVTRNGNHHEALVLNGEELKLLAVKLDGVKLQDNEFNLNGDTLVFPTNKNEFTLEVETLTNPEANKTLDGLYKSGSIFCTQCEPEGFRRITYYVDRPDNMAKFTTKVIANKKDYPILLSNGNPIAKGDLDNGEHFVTWEDPFKKPSYLFALVAGDLGVIRDHYKTTSGRNVLLEIYCDKGNEDKCHHAMESLKKSMKWDEDRFGLEYDLDIYMIVAVDAFNMGAMENKGLNIFNSAYVLANPKTATDQNFYGIESVIGHEYFHNWTGNRVTCRDWFQLTLKEGLTVFRDQEFSADMNSRDVERISSVNGLRSHQFPEDQGPTSHPIKPSSYIEINNFYTATVYEKGSEIIRMYQTLLGVDGFRKGMDKYFELFDGKAVRTEDFLHAMSVANNNYDLTQFANWYHQNGTPILHATTSYNKEAKTFTLKLRQELPKNTIKEAKPFHMPILVGLVDDKGNDIVEKLVHLKKMEDEFVFENINSKPIASINRKFSAPVKLISDLSFDDLIFLMGHDSDSFNRYEASQVVVTKIMNELLFDLKKGTKLSLNPKYVEAYGKILTDGKIDDAFKALIMTLPEESLLHQEQNPIDYKGTHTVHEFVEKTLAIAHESIFADIFKKLSVPTEYTPDANSMGRRTLRGKCRNMLMAIDEKYENEIFNQYKVANNMTDEIGDLSSLVHGNSKHSTEALTMFYNKWKHETLVMQKWLGVQATVATDATYDRVLALENDAVYDKTVPNLVRSLLLQFATNRLQFNHESGRGYKLVAERIIELDKMNPQVAARLASQYKDFKRLPENLKNLMKPELEKVIKVEGLSKNVYEIVSKILEV